MLESIIYTIEGTEYGHCILKIRKLLLPLNGIDSVDLNLKNRTIKVTGWHNQVSVITKMDNNGYHIELTLESLTQPRFL